jgi:hypothetical protein
VRDQVSHPYKTGKILVLYILIFEISVHIEVNKERKARREEKGSGTERRNERKKYGR